MATPNPYPLLVEVDQYIERLFVPKDPVLEEALRAATEAGLPEIHVSPNEGKLLYLLTKLSGAKRVLEIGLLGGYSTIWLARAVAPQGKLVTLELDEKYIQVAGKNLDLYLCANRTCEVGMEHATRAPYESFLYSLEELTRA